MNDLGWVFFVTGIVSLVAAVVALHTNVGDRAYDPTPLPPLRGIAPSSARWWPPRPTGLAVGVYETCWSLLMHAHHATTLQIRLSWTMFCLPWVLLSRVGGWIADHLNRRLDRALRAAQRRGVPGHLPAHPQQRGDALPRFGRVHRVAALSSPSIASLLSQGAQSRELSRRQGLYATSTTASMALAAIASGFLFTVEHRPALHAGGRRLVAARASPRCTSGAASRDASLRSRSATRAPARLVVTCALRAHRSSVVIVVAREPTTWYFGVVVRDSPYVVETVAVFAVAVTSPDLEIADVGGAALTQDRDAQADGGDRPRRPKRR